MSKPRGLKERQHAARLIDINKYLAVLPGEKASEKTCVTELNKMFSNIMSNIWINQTYVQGFEYESIYLKAEVKMFERTEILASIYEGVMENYHKNLLGHIPTVRLTKGKQEQKLPCQILTLRRVKALKSVENCI